MEKRGLLPDVFQPYKGKAPHGVQNWGKVKRMVRAVEGGKKLPPIIFNDRIGRQWGKHGYDIHGRYLSGTHRAAANMLLARRKRTSRRVPIVPVSRMPRNSIQGIAALLDPDRGMPNLERIDLVVDVAHANKYKHGHHLLRNPKGHKRLLKRSVEDRLKQSIHKVLTHGRAQCLN